MTPKPKHTPGPWLIEECSAGYLGEKDMKPYLSVAVPDTRDGLKGPTIELAGGVGAVLLREPIAMTNSTGWLKASASVSSAWRPRE